MSRRFGRRAGLFALLAGLSACATPDAEPVATAPEPEQDRDPEDVYSPGAIPWSDLTEEHKRRARAALSRMGEDVPDDDATLQARWLIMSPAQQRYVIRRPPPPPPRPRPRTTRRGSTRTPARRSTAPARRTTPPRRRRSP